MTINPASIGAICGNRGTGSGSRGSPDPYFSSVVALLHFEQSGSPGNVINSCPRGSATWLMNAGVTITTTNPEYGNSCLDCGNLNSGLTSTSSPDYTMGVNDFTVEASFRFASLQDVYAFDIGNNGVNSLRFDPHITSGPAVYINGSVFLGGTAPSLSLNVFHKIAVTRTGSPNTMYFFIDGVLKAAATSNHNLDGTQISIGKSISGGFPVMGQFDEFRLTKGVARYTANYAVATAPFPDF